jgi:hypothetical protein
VASNAAPSAAAPGTGRPIPSAAATPIAQATASAGNDAPSNEPSPSGRAGAASRACHSGEQRASTCATTTARTKWISLSGARAA